MIGIFVRAALCCAALLPLASAPQAAAQATLAATPSAAAQSFGALYMPLELSIDAAIMGFNREFEPAMRADANVVALDKAKPGLIEAAGKAGRETMAMAMRSAIPGAQQRLADFAAAKFSGTELAEINDFLASATGQRLLYLIAENTDSSALAEQARKTAEVPSLDGGQLLAMVDPGVAAKLNSEQFAVLVRFSASPGGKKLNDLSPQLAELVAGEMNQIVGAMTPEIEKAVVGAITAHLSAR